MNCKKAHKRIIKLVSEGSSLPKEKDLLRHLESCDSCNQIYAKVEKVFQQIGQEPVEEINPFFSAKVMSRIESEGQRTSWQEIVFKPLLKPAVTMAVVVLMVVLGVLSGDWMADQLLTNQKSETSSNNIEVLTNDLSLNHFEENSLEDLLLNE